VKAAAGRDEPAVLQHGDAVGDGLQLGHAVGDVEDRGTLAPKRSNQLEQPAGVALVERGRRLVHDDDAGIERQRLGDLDQLLLGDRQRLDRCVGVDPRGDAQKQAARPIPHRGAVEQAAARRLKPEEDVVGDAALGQQAELLVDDADPGPARLDRMPEGDGLAAKLDLAFVGPVDAAEHLHQGRLAGAVLPADRMNFPGMAVEADIVERPHAGETLADAAHRQDGRFLAHGDPAMAQPRRMTSWLSTRSVSRSGKRSRQTRVAAASDGRARPNASTVSQPS